METSKLRSGQIGNIRALAIFLVVFGHSIILYSSSWDLYESAVQVPFLDWLKRVIDIPQMPLFFSLSGYLFVFTHEKGRGLWHLVKSKFLRLIVPYLGIGFLFLLPIRLLIGFPSYAAANVEEILRKFATSSDVGHLWFLPALFFIFLMSECLLWIEERIPLVKKAPDIFLGVCAGCLYLEGYRIGLGYPPILNAYNNLLWFALGYFLCNRREWVRRVYRSAAVKWLLALLNVAMYLVQIQYGAPSVMFSVALRGLLIANTYGLMPEKTHPFITKLERNSFGIYLFHSPLIYITFAYLPNIHPVLLVLLNFLGFGAVALGLTEGIRRTKLRVLIGE